VQLPSIHHDEHIVAFDKPSGLLVHRGWGDDAVTAVDLAREAMGAQVFPVHRLDRGTSGVLLFARSAEVAAELGGCFERGEVEKTYLALVRGVPPAEGVVDHPIPRREGGPRVPAVTEYRLRCAAPPGSLPRASLVEARPRTGRLHQVRRHMKHISHPLIGDANYGKGALNRLFRDEVGLGRLALHASALCFVHPVSGERMCIEAPLPDDLAAPLGRLGISTAAQIP
jgi:tRNA pseudouridine65 synthase